MLSVVFGTLPLESNSLQATEKSEVTHYTCSYSLQWHVTSLLVTLLANTVSRLCLNGVLLMSAAGCFSFCLSLHSRFVMEWCISGGGLLPILN